MMEEGVNMIKELIKIKENNNIVSIFCDEDDTSMFLEGYIYAIGRQDFLIKHITCECEDSGTGRAQAGTSGEDSRADGGSHQPGTGQPDFRLPRHLGECIL